MIRTVVAATADQEEEEEDDDVDKKKTKKEQLCAVLYCAGATGSNQAGRLEGIRYFHGLAFQMRHRNFGKLKNSIVKLYMHTLNVMHALILCQISVSRLRSNSVVAFTPERGHADERTSERRILESRSESHLFHLDGVGHH